MILVFVEQEQGKPDRSSLEALMAAGRVASAGGSGEPVGAVLFGPGAAVAAAGLGDYGVAEANVAEEARLAAYAPAAWGRGVAQLAVNLAPSIVLAGGTDRGHEVLAYAAAMSNAPMVANCLEIRPGSTFEVTRQRWGGSLLEEARVDAAGSETRFLTVADHAFQPEPAAAAGSVVVKTFTPALSEMDLRVQVVSKVAPEAGKVSLADARVVVGGGRGVGGAEAFSELEELALSLIHI